MTDIYYYPPVGTNKVTSCWKNDGKEDIILSENGVEIFNPSKKELVDFKHKQEILYCETYPKLCPYGVSPKSYE